MKTTTTNNIDLESGNSYADSEFRGIRYATKFSVNARIPVQQEQVKIKIRNFIDRFPNYRELFLMKLKYFLETVIEEHKESGNFEPDAKMYRKAMGAVNILQWLDGDLSPEPFQEQSPVISINTPETNNQGNSNKERELTIPEIALKQFFLWKYEGKPGVTSTNAHTFLTGTTHKTASEVFKKFREYKNDRIRFEELPAKAGPGKRAGNLTLGKQIARYKRILLDLKGIYEYAYAAAQEELKYLSK